MIKALALALVAFIGIWSVPELAGQASPATRADVQAFVKKYAEAANAGDVSALMEMVSRRAGVTSVNDGEITRGWEAIRTDNDEIVGREGTYRLSVGSIDVTALGATFAIAVAPFTLTIATQQGAVQAQGAMSFVLEKQAGQWKVLHEHYSTKAPEQ